MPTMYPIVHIELKSTSENDSSSNSSESNSKIFIENIFIEHSLGIMYRC